MAALLAGSLALIGIVSGWRGVDLPAQIYRVGLFHRLGLTLWDSQWYGGHWTLDYSVIFPPVAGVIGIEATTVLSAAAAAWAFDRLVVGRYGSAGRAGSLAFALGTVVQSAIGQLPFLMGEALALLAVGAAVRRRWPAAIVLALAATLASPLAGAFLALAIVSWLVATWPRQRVGLTLVAAAVATPIVVAAVLFPGQGMFPFPPRDFAWELGTCVGLLFLVPRRERQLRAALALYGAATVASFVLPTPMGGNIGRLGECLGVPMVVALLWPVRRWLLAGVVVPLAFWQWAPAWGAIAENGRDPSSHASYYAPLQTFLADHADPAGRVEVVPTRLHWEAAYVAPSISMARGWERQLDTADNPLFYKAHGLDAARYQAWLIDNGVRYVALPDAPLDFAGVGEAELLAAGVPGLALVWQDPHWRVFEVAGSAGIVDGPARLVSLDGGNLALAATGPGPILVRVHYAPGWTIVDGSGCVAEAGREWMSVVADGPGALRLQLRLRPSPREGCTELVRNK